MSKFLSSLLIVGLLALYAAPVAEAQFLKDLVRGLEKVNEALDKAEEFTDKVEEEAGRWINFDTDRKKTEAEEGEEEALPEEVAFDDSDWDEVEPQYFTPYIGSDTKYMQIGTVYYNPVTPVHDDVFGVKSNHLYAFWSVDGQKLFDAEWEYCGFSDDYGSKYPRFDSGVAVARRRKMGEEGDGHIHLLYKDGSVVQLDKSFSEVTSFRDGLAIATRSVNYKKENVYINIRGERQFPHITLYTQMDNVMRPLREGMRAFPTSNYTWGYIDEKGNIVLESQYANVSEFSEGYAWVVVKTNGPYSSQGKLVLIDKQGNEVFDPGVPMSGISFSSYYGVGFSDVVNGRFFVTQNDKLCYYNVAGELLASYDYGTPFYDGCAFVSDDRDVMLMDTDMQILRYFNSDYMFATDLDEFPRFTSLGCARIENVDVNSSIINSRGNILISYYYSDDSSDRIDGFGQYTESGYSLVTNIEKNGNKMLAQMDTRGQLVWLFGELPYEEYFEEDNNEKNRIFPIYPEPWEVDTLIEIINVGTPPIGPKPPQKIQYTVTVKANPAEGGTATLLPGNKFYYGDNAAIMASPNEGWALADITTNKTHINAPKNESPFTVYDDMEVTVHFVEKEVLEDPATGVFQGEKMVNVFKDKAYSITFYAQMSAMPDEKNPYGDNTHGFIVSMIDPTYRFTSDDLSSYIFSAPFRILGYQHDKESDRHWLVVDGGSFTFGNLKINPDGDPLSALIAQMMITFDFGSSPTVQSRCYRIEMLDMDEESGEFTCGALQTYSPLYGWLAAQDERLEKVSQGIFSVKNDKGLPADYFEGLRMKKAEKRDDVYWYPPIEWYDGNQSILERVVNEMGHMYHGHESEYDSFFTK